MQKPALLRDHLTTRLPELARDPERLKIWVDRGDVRSTMTASRSFAYRYTLNLLLVDWGAHPSVIMILVLEWLRRQQPDLVASNQSSGFAFEADIIDKDIVDIQLSMNLTETVRVTMREDGGFDMEHVIEPEPLFPDDATIVEAGAPLTELWWRDERVLPLPDA